MSNVTKLKRNKKIKVTLLLIVATVGFFTLVSKKNIETSEKTTHLNVTLFTMPYTRALAELEEDFEAQTGMTVDIRVVGQGIYENRIILSFLGKTGDLDVVHAPLVQLPRWVKAGWMRPFAEDEMATLGKADFFPGPLSVLSLHGQSWAVPFFAETGILAYRKDILREKGFKSAPETWEDMLTTAAAINSSDTSAIALRGASGQGENMFIFPMIMRAYGGAFFEDYPDDLTVSIDSPEVEKALDIYAELIGSYSPRGGGNFKFPEVTASMQAGKSAMIIDATGVVAQVVDPDLSPFADKIGLAPVPSGPAGRSPAIAVHGFGIPSDANSPEASLAFIRWATSEDVLTKIALSDAYPDFTRISVSKNPEVIKKYITIHPDFLRVKSEALSEAIGHYRPLLPEWPEIGAAVGDNINAAVNDVVSHSAALSGAAKEMDEIIGNDHER